MILYGASEINRYKSQKIAAQDQLKGIYFQAVQQQSFNVYFVRMK